MTATLRPPSGTSGPGRPVVWLARHGETEWSRTLRHTGRTDLPLTAEGEREARALREPLRAVRFDRVLCSPLSRARETCELAGLGDRAELRDDLLEWDYGEYEGRTSADIHADRPEWLLWRDGCPGGESPEQVGARADRVIAELLTMEEGIPGGTTVAVFAHGHVLRVLTARWLDLPPADGRLFGLGTATLSRLGWEHDYRVIQRWNAPV
ncbi:MAG: histidine phosphatase family protein [Solirubrobacterales bacterium]|nr:histidine phosphatase family protein [Solirubrobacterales bacterium]